ncbi:MAG: mechanosensitive ion channel [Deltaproteobacteria bacterium]|nr:mechanosensitive ion channel [Deltaproteobacteria bacterium]
MHLGQLLHGPVSHFLHSPLTQVQHALPVKTTPSLQGLSHAVFTVDSVAGVLRTVQTPLLTTAGLATGAYALHRTLGYAKQKIHQSSRIKDTTKPAINTALTTAELVFDTGALLAVLHSWNILNINDFITRQLPGIGKVGALGLGAYLLYRHLSNRAKAIKDDPNITERGKKMTGLGLKLAQTALLGGAAIFGLKSIGVDVTALVAGMGLLGLGLGFALQDPIKNLATFFLSNMYQHFGIGDSIVIGEHKGVVKQVTPFSVELRDFDVFGDGVVVTVPNSALIGTATTRRDKHPALIAAIKVGDYISLKEKRGRVAAINDYVMFIEAVDAKGVVVTEPVDLNDVNPHTFRIRDEIKTLVQSLTQGDCVTIKDKTGKIAEIKEPTIIIETIDANGYLIREVIDLNHVNPSTFTNYKRALPSLPLGLKAGDEFEIVGKKYRLMERPDPFTLICFPLNDDWQIEGRVSHNPHKAENTTRADTMQKLMPKRVEKTFQGFKSIPVKDLQGGLLIRSTPLHPSASGSRAG